MFPSVDLRTGQTGNLSGNACGLWPLGSPDIRNCFHTPKKETGNVTTNDLNLVDVLSSKIVSSSLKKMLAVSGKVNITFVYISPSQNWLLPLAQSILPLLQTAGPIPPPILYQSIFLLQLWQNHQDWSTAEQIYPLLVDTDILDQHNFVQLKSCDLLSTICVRRESTP